MSRMPTMYSRIMLFRRMPEFRWFDARGFPENSMLTPSSSDDCFCQLLQTYSIRTFRSLIFFVLFYICQLFGWKWHQKEYCQHSHPKAIFRQWNNTKQTATETPIELNWFITHYLNQEQKKKQTHTQAKNIKSDVVNVHSHHFWRWF